MEIAMKIAMKIATNFTKTLFAGFALFTAIVGVNPIALAAHSETISAAALQKVSENNTTSAHGRRGESGEYWKKLQTGDVCLYPDLKPVPLHLVKQDCPELVIYPKAVEMISNHPGIQKDAAAHAVPSPVVKASWFDGKKNETEDTKHWSCDKKPYAGNDMYFIGVVDNDDECEERATHCHYEQHDSFPTFENHKKQVRCIGIHTD